MIEFFLNCVLLLAAPLFFAGLVRVAVSRDFSDILKPLKEFLKLLGEGVRPGSDTHFIHETASSLILASILMAGVLVPMVSGKAVLVFENSGVLFFSFLLLEKIIRSFGGKVSPKAVKGKRVKEFMGTLPELTVYLLFMTASWMNGSVSFERFFSATISGKTADILFSVLSPLTLLFLLVNEKENNAEGYSGSDRGVVYFSSALKEFLFASMITGFVLASFRNTNVLLYFFLFLAVTAIIAVLTGSLRSLLRRYGHEKLPDYLPMIGASAVIVLTVIAPLL